MVTNAILDMKKKVHFRCPACKKTYHKDFSGRSGVVQGAAFTCRCPCGAVFQISIDRRRHRRKPTRLSGAYLHERHRLRGGITVNNLSKSGAGIHLHTARDIYEGDVLTIRFNLDDPLESFVSKEGVIRKKNGQDVGVEFSTRTWPDDPLYNYLR